MFSLSLTRSDSLPSPLLTRAIIQHITTGKADNAVQATHYINSTITTHISSQTVSNFLKAAHLKAVTKKKSLFSPSNIGREE
jgi:hypothetical protein